MYIEAITEYYAQSGIDGVFYTITTYHDTTQEVENATARSGLLHRAIEWEKDATDKGIELVITSATVTVNSVTQSNPVDHEQRHTLWTTQHKFY